MKTSKQIGRFSQTALALSVLAAFAPAQAQELADLIAPGNSISVGVAGASGDKNDRARFGMFNGLRDKSGTGILGFTYQDRDSASAKWFTLEGRNLGLDNREVGFSYRKLGDLKLWGDYSEVVRHDPRTINTGMTGIGTTTPTVGFLNAPGAGNDVNLQLARKSISLNAEKWLDGAVQMEVNFKNEDKTGARFWGRGFACTSVTVGAGCTGAQTGTNTATTVQSWALLLVPEPVSSTIRQIDAKVNWSGEKLKLSGAFYGSYYTNANGNVTPGVGGTTFLNPLGTAYAPGSVGLNAILGLPMALWPDNQANQLSLAGNYALTHGTKLNFKYSYNRATQTESFANMGLTGAPAGLTDLNGKVVSQKAQFGFSSHVSDKAHLHGDVKYESRDDRTPVARYNTEFLSSTSAVPVTYTNDPRSSKKLDGKLEGSYRLPRNYLAVATLSYEADDRGAFTPTAALAGISGIRQKTEELGWRLEGRKTMSEVLNGSVSYGESTRKGDSNWLKPLSLQCQGLGGIANAGAGVVDANTSLLSVSSSGTAANCARFNNGLFGTSPIFPFIMSDAKRNKGRAVANWQPDDRLGMTFMVTTSRDGYTPPVGDHGLRNANNRQYSADASYTLNADWRLNGFLSRGEQRTAAGHSNGYDATLKDTADSLGIGLVGKPAGRWRLGADLHYLRDLLKYGQTQDPAESAANAAFLNTVGGLPDVTYKLTRLKAFAEYALDKTAYLRFDLVHQRTFFDEWTYNYNGASFFYGDNTTLNAKQNQSVTFLGAAYVMRFQ